MAQVAIEEGLDGYEHIAADKFVENARTVLSDQVVKTVREAVGADDDLASRADLALRQITVLRAVNALNEKWGGAPVGTLWPYDGRSACRDQHCLYVYAQNINLLMSGWVQGARVGKLDRTGGWKVEIDITDCATVEEICDKFRNMWVKPKDRVRWIDG